MRPVSPLARPHEEGAAPAPFVPVASVGDVPPGWVLAVQVGGRRVALANSGGTLLALDHDCSHAGGPLGDNRLHDGCYLECPWHNAVFDVRTGEVCRGPARKPQARYPVRVEGDTVLVGLAPLPHQPGTDGP
ncbi:MAG: Rieske (2Fe-2S) protein [Acidimicrobiales bacterium]